ncbi:MAG: DUF1080 domain-containing protein [Verrucomicrobia bacterium]|nr:MAG: DUF1080 domain-containing protein [Verrucomicrobiota bacterium]
MFTGCISIHNEPGFTLLFDRRSLHGWRAVGAPDGSYLVKDGAIICTPKGKNLFTEAEFSDFILRFEFKLDAGSNNGIGIRAPFQGDAAYLGMETQVLEETAALAGKWGKLRPEQFHGSIYDVVPAKRGALKPVGEWNEEEISAVGRQIRVTLNGQVILDANLNDVTDAEKIRKHPGLFRERGHIGFLGHGDHVEFRNLRIKDLSQLARDGTPPPGFTSLFNGKNLDGWKGLVADPEKRAAMSPEQLAAEQAKADDLMRANWKIEDGALVYTGTNYDNLCTTQDFANFELLADWKIEPHADSGFYLRGSPQVQIWDPFTQPTKNGSEIGSGGLYNNKTNPSQPTSVADKPVGEWNHFQIIMAGEKVHVFLNGQLIVNGATLENYWDRSASIYPAGQLEIQAHKSRVWFKNLYVREIK